MGDYEGIIANSTEVIRIYPQDGDAYRDRGLAYDQKGDYEAAISDYTEAIRLEPQDAEAYRERGRAYEALGKLDEAAADYEQFNDLTNNEKIEDSEEETDNDKDQVIVDTVDMLRGMMSDEEFEKFKEDTVRTNTEFNRLRKEYPDLNPQKILDLMAKAERLEEHSDC